MATLVGTVPDLLHGDYRWGERVSIRQRPVGVDVREGVEAVALCGFGGRQALDEAY